MLGYGITLNYIAILVAAVVTFAFGMVWYNPILFGKQWMAAHAYTPEQVAAMQREMPKTYGISFITYLVMSAGVAIMIGLTGIARWQGGLKLGALIWLLFVATTGLTMNLFSGKKMATWLIDTGYQLVCLAAMGAILAAWR